VNLRRAKKVRAIESELASIGRALKRLDTLVTDHHAARPSIPPPTKVIESGWRP